MLGTAGFGTSERFAMGRSRSSATIRRDDRLDRTRKLSVLIAGGATVASVGLAGMLGAAIPGHSVMAGKTAGAGVSGRRQGTGQTGSSKTGSSKTASGQAYSRRHRLSGPAS